MDPEELELLVYAEPTCAYSLSHHKRITLDITRGSVAAVSTLFLVVSLLILCCKDRLIYIYNFRLVLYQLLSSILYSLVTVSQITAIWYEKEGTTVAALCKVVGLGLTYSNWTVVLFKFYIVLEVLWFAVVNDTKKILVRTKRKEFLVVMSLVLIPAFFSWVPYTNDTFGYSGAWCWIRKKSDNCTDNPVALYEELGLWYAPLFLLMALLFIMICTTVVLLFCRWRKTRHRARYAPLPGSETNLDMLKMLPLLGYPAIYILTHLIALADRIMRFAVGSPPYWLVMAHAATNPAGGLFVSICFWVHLVLVSVLKRRVTKTPVDSPPTTPDSPPTTPNSTPTTSNSSRTTPSDEGGEQDHDEQNQSSSSSS